MAIKPGYNQLSARLTQVGYGANDRIQRYMDDNPQEWARELYEAIITDNAIRVDILTYMSTHDPAALTRYAELLLALSPLSDQTLPDGKVCTYASKYYARLMQKMGLIVAPSIKADEKVFSALEEWLPEWVERYRELLEGKLNDPQHPLPPADRGELQTQLDQLDAAVHKYGGYAAFTRQFVNDLRTIQGSTLYERLQKWAATFEYGTKVLRVSPFVPTSAA